MVFRDVVSRYNLRNTGFLEKLYIQVALKIDNEKTAEREFGNLLKIQDNYPKIVITEDTFEGNSYEGIRHCPIRQFLME